MFLVTAMSVDLVRTIAGVYRTVAASMLLVCGSMQILEGDAGYEVLGADVTEHVVVATVTVCTAGA